MKKRVFSFDEVNFDNKNLYKKINLKNVFTHIRGYHGCRPLHLDNYYDKGIIPINKEQALRQALDLLQDEWISEDNVVELFNSHWSNLMEVHKYVWFTLTKKELLDSCGHYLIYGSEFICGMAADLGCQRNLKRKGIPTIFHCDVPIEKIPEDYLEELNNQVQIGNGDNYGFKVIGTISKNDIIKCEHPAKILDPLNGFLPYYVEI